MALHWPLAVKQGFANQVSKLLKIPNLSCIHSVDSLKLAKKISERASFLIRKIDIMLQLKPQFYYTLEEATEVLAKGTSIKGKPIEYSLTKSGLDLSEVPPVIKFLKEEQKSVNLCGIMIIGEPGDISIFDTMKNIKHVLQETFHLDNLGRLTRTLHGDERGLFGSRGKGKYHYPARLHFVRGTEINKTFQLIIKHEVAALLRGFELLRFDRDDFGKPNFY